MPPSEKWQKGLEQRLAEHLKKNPEKPSIQKEKVQAFTEKTTSQSPESVRQENEAAGWDLYFSGPKTLSPEKLPELLPGEKLETVYTSGRKLIFFLKQPVQTDGIDHSPYNHE